MDKKLIISFDVWGTLIKASPAFSKSKISLVRKYAKYPISEQRVLDVFKEIKSYHDSIIELFGNQPDNYTIFCELFYKLGLNPSNIVLFIEEYEKLFLKHLPKIIGQIQPILSKLKEEGHILLISSNTLFIKGDILNEALKKIGIGEYFLFSNFSDNLKVSKPNENMFWFRQWINISKPNFFTPDYHIGDNPITDGACEKFGIRFYQINSNEKTIEDFYEEVILSNTGN